MYTSSAVCLGGHHTGGGGGGGYTTPSATLQCILAISKCTCTSSASTCNYMYRKLGNFRCWDIFVLDIVKRMKLKRMCININVHGKGLFVRKLFNTKIYCAKYF